MKEVFINYWYLFLGSILIGVLLTLFSQEKFKGLVKSFYGKAPLIKKYWLFVVPFSVVSISAYVLTIKSSPSENLANNISLLNQATTIIFAIFAGYFAFQQLVEYRLEKLKEQGYLYFKQKSYLRAIQYYEEAYAINPKDFSLLAELLEVYLCLGDFKKIDDKINQLEKLIVEDYERSTIAYLRVCKHLFKQDLGSAKAELKSYIELVTKKPATLLLFNWDFSDIRNCELCQKLDGEAKTIFDNLVSYLNKRLDEEKKKRFEVGDYILKEASTKE